MLTLLRVALSPFHDEVLPVLSMSALLQLYAPLAGLLAVVFWLGVLSNRVRQLEDKTKSDGSMVSDIAVLKSQVGDVREDIAGIHADINGINRILANIASKGLEYRPHG